MRSSIRRCVPAVLLAGSLLLGTSALAQWPPAPPQQPYPGMPSSPIGQPGPGPILLPTPGAPQGPSAPPREAATQPALSESPTRIESEKVIVEHNPTAWAKDSVRISPDGKRFAVVIHSEDKATAHASIDGQDQKNYGWVRDLAFSGDSRHVAYVADARREGPARRGRPRRGVSGRDLGRHARRGRHPPPQPRRHPRRIRGAEGQRARVRDRDRRRHGST